MVTFNPLGRLKVCFSGTENDLGAPPGGGVCFFCASGLAAVSPCNDMDGKLRIRARPGINISFMIDFIFMAPLSFLLRKVLPVLPFWVESPDTLEYRDARIPYPS